MALVDPAQRWRENPYFLLGIAPGASELEIEREGRKLLAQLELGLDSVKRVVTPLGAVERTADAVRAALAELRDPRKRRAHALWARVPHPAVDDGDRTQGALEPFHDSMRAIGWPGL